MKFSKNCIIDSVSVFGEKSSIYGRVTDSQIEAGVAIYGSVLTCNIGKGSYVADNSFLENCSVGKYTSIGQRVNIIRGGHPAKDWVSTSPSFFSLNSPNGICFASKQEFEEYKWLDAEKRIAVQIENDVWIGNDVKILEGIKIGNGAIIGAGAVVVSDVEAYTVVGGVPAKLIRKRFKENEIVFLNKFCWWNKDEKWLGANVSFFRNINDFVDRFYDSIC